MNKWNRPKFFYAIPFFLVLLGLAVVCCIPSLHPTRSYSERRELAEFPQLTGDTLLSGEYFQDISTWFSDTFPGREGWLEAADAIQSLHGSADVMIAGTIPVSDEIPPEIGEETQPLEVFTPEDMAPPAVTESPGEADSDSVSDSASEPTQWQGATVGDAAEILKDATAFQIGDAAYVYQNFSQRMSDRYASVLNQLVEKVDSMGITVVSAPPPTAVGVMFEEEYQEELNSVSQFKIMDYINSRLDDRIVTVDMLTALQQHNGEYIYFRTDHHWTPLGAYYAYRALCESLDFTPVELSEFTEYDVGEFVGGLSGRVLRPGKLKTDTMIAYFPDDDVSVTVTQNDGISYPTKFYAYRDTMTKQEKYGIFGADVDMTTYVNNSMEEGPSVLIVRDSFASCFIPYLTQHFKTIYTVDYRRFYRCAMVSELQKLDISYVIVMPYITAIQDSTGPNLIYHSLFGY